MKSLLDKVNAKLNAQGGFLKAVSVLVGGTAFAQVIGFICLPILTRLYTPEDYSILGVYVAIVAILSVVTCLRFDIAIPIPSDNNEGRNILYLALISNIIFSIIISIVLFFIYPFISNFKIIKELSIWIYLIPIGVFLTGLYSALQFWATRNKQFKVIAQTRITQAVFGNATSMGFGFYLFGFAGLILGQLLSYSGGLLKLARNFFNDRGEYKDLKLKENFIKYKDFPKYSTLEGLANTSAIQLPLIIIATFLIGPEVGYLMLAMKVLGIPMGLVGSAISQVYVSEATEYYKDKKIFTYTKKIVFKICKITLIPFLFLMILSPYVFPYIFGKGWSSLGFYVMAMIPWYFMQILASPISMSLHIISEQKLALLIQFLGFFIRVIGLILVAYFFKDKVIAYYIVSGFVFYTIYLLIVLYRLYQTERLH